MGQTLTEPILTKNSSSSRNAKYRVGSSSMQGWRVSMEDSETLILDLPEDPGTAFFAVYDGHGGAMIAQHASKHLHKYIVRQKDYAEGNIVKAIQNGFLELDADMQADETLKNNQSGTTVIAVLIKDNVVYCANAGDSRAVACVKGRALALSEDHKPVLEEEQNRIEAAGGWVEFNRVNGHLALSRALGDYMFKMNDSKGPEEQIVTAFPDVSVNTINEDWDFLVLACDGIWDVMTSEEVVQFVRSQLAELLAKEGQQDESCIEPEDICEELLTNCVAPDTTMGTGCDNMTAIVVFLLHGKPYSQIVLKVKESVNRDKYSE